MKKFQFSFLQWYSAIAGDDDGSDDDDNDYTVWFEQQ